MQIHLPSEYREAARLALAAEQTAKKEASAEDINNVCLCGTEPFEEESTVHVDYIGVWNDEECPPHKAQAMCTCSSTSERAEAFLQLSSEKTVLSSYR